jgi:hypothetical protein
MAQFAIIPAAKVGIGDVGFGGEAQEAGPEDPCRVLAPPFESQFMKNTIIKTSSSRAASAGFYSSTSIAQPPLLI